MIDWLSVVVPFEHDRMLHGNQLLETTPQGEVVMHIHKRAVFRRPSHDATLTARSTPTKNAAGRFIELELSGNPVKWLQGHNAFGTDDLPALVEGFVSIIEHHYGIKASSDDWLKIKAGQYKLTRVDVTAMFATGARGQVEAILEAVANRGSMRHRGRGVLKSGTVYFGQRSRRWSLKLYCKAAEMKVHPPAQCVPERDALLAWVEDKLRVEVTLRGMELEKRNLRTGASWSPDVAWNVIQTALDGMNWGEAMMIEQQDLSEMPSGCRLAYEAWRGGRDIRPPFLKRRTFYKYRRELLAHGVDIAVPRQVDGIGAANVVPLVRVVELRPAEVPSWAKASGAYVCPRSWSTALRAA